MEECVVLWASALQFGEWAKGNWHSLGHSLVVAS